MSKAEPEAGRGGARILVVAEDYDGQRLDNFLLRELKGLPRTRLYRALRKGEVRVNKGRVKADYRVCTGDQVRIPPLRLPEPGQAITKPGRWGEQLRERILYEDAGLLAINKPAGLAVHGGSGLTAGLIEVLRLSRPEDRYLELVHRLDRETSGVLLVARKPAVLKDLHRQLREDRMDKRYLALVAGRWSAKRLFVDAPLKKNALKSGERLVTVEAEGKASRTDFKVVQRFGGCTLLEARPRSGRTHQIRVHAQYAGHPLLGDSKYASREAAQWAKEQGLGRLFLHAASLGFDRGEQGRLILEAPLDQDLQQFLQKIGK